MTSKLYVQGTGPLGAGYTINATGTKHALDTSDTHTSLDTFTSHYRN